MKTLILLLCSYAAFGQGAPILITHSSVDLKLDKFRQQRNFGKQMQFIGIGFAAASFLIKPKNELKFVGAGFYAIGVAVDFDASRHLRLSPRKKRR